MDIFSIEIRGSGCPNMCQGSSHQPQNHIASHSHQTSLLAVK